MSRAPAMSAEDRRQEIISATLPLLAEHGWNVTTSQIAQAAGIAEGTIFRVFDDKRDLVLAALGQAMSADAEVEHIRAIRRDLPAAERLAAALHAVSGYQDRLWSLMRTLQASGWLPGHDEFEQHHPRRQMERIGESIGELLEPEARSLKLDPCSAARLLLGLAFTNHLREAGMGEPSIDDEGLVDLFLHGVTKAAAL